MTKLLDAIEDKPELHDINRSGFIVYCPDGQIPFTQPGPGISMTSFEMGLYTQLTSLTELRLRKDNFRDDIIRILKCMSIPN